MPTRGRPQLAQKAVQCFLSQTYPNKQLLILDDADEPSFRDPLVPLLPEVSYFRREGKRMNIAEKRNELCQFATGEIIMHFDDDDWSSPSRMADQVQRMEETAKQLTGYHSLLFYCASPEAFHKYHGKVNYGLGTSLAYTKAFWKQHPFHQASNKPHGEDNNMIVAGRNANEIIAVDAEQRMVALIHSGNTCRKHVEGAQYRKVDRSEFPDAFFK